MGAIHYVLSWKGRVAEGGTPEERGKHTFTERRSLGLGGSFLRVPVSLVVLFGMVVLFVSPVSAGGLEVRLVCLPIPSRECSTGMAPELSVLFRYLSRHFIIVETTPGAECEGSINASRVGYESGSAQLSKTTASSEGRAGWLLFGAGAAGFYTIAITCTLGEQSGRLVTSFSVS